MSNSVSTISQQIINLDALAGDTFALLFKFFEANGTTPVDVSNYIFVMEIKPATNKLCNPVVRLMNNSGITIGGAGNNEVSINTILNIKGGKYVYDIEATLPDSSKTTYVGGAFTITQDVTNSNLEQ